MKITINKSELQSVIAAPAKIASGASMAYLSCIRILANDGKATFEATDLNSAVKVEAAVFDEEDGCALISARKLSDIVRTLPDQAVTIEADTSSASIVCGKSRFAIPALDPDDFPSFPTFKPEQTVTIPAAQFADMVSRVSLAAAKDEARLILTGIQVEAAGGVLSMASTDSYRIICAEADAPESASFKAVLPCAFMQQAASFKADGDVTLSVSDAQSMVEADGVTLVTRAIEGNYPNWRQLMPKDDAPHVKASVSLKDLKGAMKRAAAIASKSSPVRINVRASALDISSETEDGSMSEEVECSADGTTLVNLNAAYAADTLAAMDADDIRVWFCGELRPPMFIGDRVRSIIMPVRG